MANFFTAAKRKFCTDSRRGRRALCLFACTAIEGGAMNRDISQPVAFQFSSAEQQSRAAMLGLWVFLATELMFFGPLFFGYWIGRLNFPDEFAAASRHTEVALGTANTA